MRLPSSCNSCENGTQQTAKGYCQGYDYWKISTGCGPPLSQPIGYSSTQFKSCQRANKRGDPSSGQQCTVSDNFAKRPRPSCTRKWSRSIAFGLRISVAATAAPDEAQLRFRGTKGRAGLHRPIMGPWAPKWGDFLARLRALSGHHPHRPVFFTSKAHLAAAFLELVQLPRCPCKTIAGTAGADLGRQSFRRSGCRSTWCRSRGGGVEIARGGKDVHHTPLQLDVCQRRAHAGAKVAKEPATVVRSSLAFHGGLQRVGPRSIANAPPPPQRQIC